MIPIFAGFWRRCAAFILDGIVLAIPNIALRFLLPDNTYATFFSSLAIGLAYYAGLHSSPLQATVGKMAFGIKVTDLLGKRISVGLAIGRYFATWLSLIILGIGFLMAAFTDKKRALHDILCKTLVINREAQSDDLADENNHEVMAVTWPVWAVVLLLFVLPLVASMVAAVALPMLHDSQTRAQLEQALARIEPIKQEMVESLSAKRAIRPGARTLESPLVQSATVDATGQITVTFAGDLGGGKVFLAPLVARSNLSEWRCWAEGVPARYMPIVCRE
ncbi:MAG: RDD family protein [Usitatibacter sp.]